jgi:hypothetical protein
MAESNSWAVKKYRVGGKIHGPAECHLRPALIVAAVYAVAPSSAASSACNSWRRAIR